MTMSNETRSRLGGLATASRHPTRGEGAYTERGLKAMHGLGRFLKDIPADLPEEERVRRAMAARKAWYTAQGAKGGAARRRRR